MRSAFYGRRNLGRCVRTNFGFVGCYADVVRLMDRRCTGRTSCDVDVIEPNFDDIRPCNVELKSYLQADYTCITGQDLFQTQCFRREEKKYTDSKPIKENCSEPSDDLIMCLTYHL